MDPADATSGIQLMPAPYSSRFQAPTFMPLYYTSDLFVSLAREDIGGLLDAFAAHFASQSAEDKPFNVFKGLWKERGWCYIHLKCTEAWSRRSFLQTMFRLWIGKFDPEHPIQQQVGAFFGLYIFYSTQPRGPNGLYALNKIPIAIDTYRYLLTLPDVAPELFTPYLLHLLTKLLESDSFAILPASSLCPYATRTLPNASVVPYTYSVNHKGGRPTRTKILARTRLTVENLERWSDDMDARQSEDRTLESEAPDPSEYIASKAKLRSVLPPDMLRAAEQQTRDSMRNIEQYAKQHSIMGEHSNRTEWLDGARRLEEQDHLLDFIRADNGDEDVDMHQEC